MVGSKGVGQADLDCMRTTLTLSPSGGMDERMARQGKCPHSQGISLLSSLTRGFRPGSFGLRRSHSMISPTRLSSLVVLSLKAENNRNDSTFLLGVCWGNNVIGSPNNSDHSHASPLCRPLLTTCGFTVLFYDTCMLENTYFLPILPAIDT